MTEQTRRHEWQVTGMDCAACTVKVTKAVERLPGVSDVKVALMSERLSLNLAPGAAPEEVEAVVRRLGYDIGQKSGPAPEHAAKPDNDHHDHDHDHDHEAPGHVHSHDNPADRGKAWYLTGKGRLVILTGILLAMAWIFELLTSVEYGYWAFLGACVIGVAPVAKRAFEALRMGQPFTIESLMTIAAIGALFIGAAEEAALVVFLFAVGEVLEGVAANKARDGIRALANLVPKTAIIEENGQSREIPAETLTIGQTVLVRPGDRVPADGTILSGTSGIDESPVTGESVPVTKGPGDAVFAGAINAEAVLRVTVTREAADNTISRIIRLVEEAEESRAPTERFIDRFSRIYMPAIVGISLLVILIPPLAAGADWGTWIYRGLALLLIGCPCALVISVPASIASALSAGAKKGLLLKGGAVIEATANIRNIAFDKTGTLTWGRPEVTDLVAAAGVPEADLLAVAGAVETGSSHPLARAVLARVAAAGVTAHPAREAKAIIGKGVEALVTTPAGEVRAWVSSPSHAAEAGGLPAEALARANTLEAEGKTVVAVFTEGQPLGLIAMRDEPREDAALAIRQLGSLGIGATILTGDNPRTAAAIAAGLGMEFRAQMMPADKLNAIRQLREAGGVMMIGDGINDAPALKQADVGVAMGSGTDVALETADAAILRDRVADVPALIRLSRATMDNIRQNITLALGLKAVFLVTSVLGITGLWIAILADTGATVLVTLNALRLLRFDPSRNEA
ncbi:cadmium-translocating P-type ATPase [Xinfangfangia sp. D13-10-4-6]|uniref:heavy metal translocating P-type ATPase n=1 Tax=Pseudogemmobacter hezensis TaxID=2737662 RepID=UPI0015547473|nr:heavy metal translocating P-type ATPase [Pseudogemmobacter hezensis]NPD14199.1 cadmium-translocating P-type ATPase [Pseudogemmobacter hezensis]